MNPNDLKAYDRAVAAHLGVAAPNPSAYDSAPKLTPEQKINVDKLSQALSSDEKINQIFEMLNTITEHMVPMTNGLSNDIVTLEKRIAEIAQAQMALSERLKRIEPKTREARRATRSTKQNKGSAQND